MATNAGRNDVGREAPDSDPLAADEGRGKEPAFSDEGMRRIVQAQDRDRRSEAFSEDTAELEDSIRGRRRLVPVVIAFAALLCFAAIVWYAYTWGTGQMTTDQLPVVTAEVGPEKSRPEQPGGLEVPHQDKLVLNNGEAAGNDPVVERLLPPPETPKPPEPLPQSPASEIPEIPAVPDIEAQDPAGEERIVAAPAEEPPAQPADGAPVDQAKTVVAEELPLEEPASEEGAEASDVALPQLKPDSEESPSTDEPAHQAEDRLPAAPEAEPQDQIAELLARPPLQTANGDSGSTPADLQAGDIVLQLSSVRSEGAATEEWARLQRAHPELLGDRRLSLETALVKGSTYYRVQTGPFPSRGAAAELCGQLKTRNQDCLVKRR